MGQNKVKILVASHKPDKVFSNDVYIPIHVGRATSKYKDEMKDMIGDDTGDNISNKNPYYCELTAQYWAWKNLDSEYVGLCHYRRYFETIITTDNIDKLLDGKDVILAKRIICPTSVISRLYYATSQEDVYLMIACIKKLYPDYLPTVMKFLYDNIVIGYNMFVMRKTLFDKFANWQFTLLTELEKYVKISGYTRQKRIFGYYAEVLLPIFCIHNNLKIRYSPIVNMVGDHERVSFKDYCRVFRNRMSFATFVERGWDHATIIGLQADFPNDTILKYIPK